MPLQDCSIAMEVFTKGNIGQVDEWEKVHKIKLHWNNWFDVSFAPLFCYLRLDSDRPA